MNETSRNNIFSVFNNPAYLNSFGLGQGKDDGMIKLTRMNKSEFFLNVNLIEIIEETPDTVVTLTNGHKMIVTESAEQIIEKIIEYKRKIYIHDIDIIKRY